MADQMDLLMRELSGEIGGTVEAVAHFAAVQAEHTAAFVVQRAVRMGGISSSARTCLTQLGPAVAAAGRFSQIAPVLAGEVAAASSLLALRAGLLLLRSVNRAVSAAR